ncbi:TolC family protein [Hydrogenobacter hydrogenophilus]|uniref:Outer membrane protein TolC n=1 Tax=Hydrogenobacter hydrogenophilus TaxID=35835 RepID=A0A285NVC8_9AQUI|nr:TolC family protein [Hydrogenobacter hydrogenophilus]SNZ12977.1 Outer membrane protein TolC [Hydrogenobacter hydrogenophilus]
MRLALLLFSFSLGFCLTLEDAIKSAQESNPELKAQEHAIKSAFYNLKGDTSLYLPEVFLNFSFNRLSSKQKLNIPAFDGFPPLAVDSAKISYKNFSAGLREVLYDGGAREGRIGVSSSEVRLQGALYEEKIQDIKLRVIKAYLDVLSARDIVEIYSKQLEAIRAQYERAKAFYKEGLVAITDVLQAQVRLAEVQRDLRQAEGNYSIALANLSKLTGIKEDSLKDLEPLKSVSYTPESFQKLYQMALENRPILRVYSERVVQARRLTEIERSKYLPKVFVQAQYTYSDQNPIISPKGVYALSVGLNVDFQSTEPYYRVLSKVEDELRAKWELENAKENLRLEVKQTYENLLTARDNMKVAEDSLKYAEEFYKLSEEQYKNQIISSTDLLLAEASLTQARKNKVISYYEYLKAYYELMRAVGGLR